MAEVTGQIGAEQVFLDNAATEETLRQLLSVSTMMAAKLGSDAIPSEEQLTKFYDQLKKSTPQMRRQQRQTADQIKELKKQENALKDNKGSTDDLSESQTEAAFSAGEFGQKVLAAGDKLVGITRDLSGMGDSVSGAAGLFQHLPVVGGLVGGVFTAIAQAGERLQTSFVQTASVGATFNGSIQQMVSAASGAGLTFDQFSGIIERNARGFALLGEGTDAGAQRFADLGRQMRVALADNGLANLGFTAESANEAMAGYVSRLARSGHAQGRSTEDLVESSTEYLKNLSAISRLTGESVKDLQGQQDAMQNDAKFRALLARSDADTADELNRLMLSVPEGMRSGAMEVLATGTATTEAGRRFLAYMEQTGQGFMQLGQTARSGGRITREATDAQINAMRDEAEALADSPLGQTLAMFAPEMNDFMIAAFDMSRRSGDVAKLRAEVDEAAAQNTDKTATAMVAAQTRLAEVSNNITAGLATNVDTLSDILQETANLLEKHLLSGLRTFSEFFSEHGDKTIAALGALTAAFIAQKAIMLGSTMLGGPGGGGGGGGAGRGGGRGGAGRAVAGALGRAAVPLAIGASAFGLIQGRRDVSERLEADEITEQEAKEERTTLTSQAVGEIGGGLVGAKIGATVGAIGGPLGMAAGGIIGGGVGFLMGRLGGRFAGEQINAIKRDPEASAAIDDAEGTIIDSLSEANEEISSGVISTVVNNQQKQLENMGEEISSGVISTAIANQQRQLENMGLASIEVTDGHQREINQAVSQINNEASTAASKIINSSLDSVKTAHQEAMRELANKELSKIDTQQEESPDTVAVQTASQMTASEIEDQKILSDQISQLNGKLDQLIAINTRIFEVEARQLSVQQGLNSNLFSGL